MCWIQICQSGHTRCEITCPVILLCFICVLKWMGWIYNHIVCISPVEWRRRAGVLACLLACLAGRSCKTWHHIATCPVVHLGKYHLLTQWNDTTRNVFFIFVRTNPRMIWQKIDEIPGLIIESFSSSSFSLPKWSRRIRWTRRIINSENLLLTAPPPT